MSTEQKPVPTSLNMDARNFLRAINNSAQSKVTFFESVIKRLGQEAKKNFRLVALHPTSLYFEDANTHDYYMGDIKKDGVRFIIENIKRLNIVEEKKADLFDKNCVELVEAVSDQDFKSAEKAFNRIEMQRFRSRVIPESGCVMTRDGEVRKINVNTGTVKEDRMPKIIKAFADAVADSVELVEGQVVRGTFVETGEQFIIPVDEYTRRCVVARKMRQVAEEAHRSPSFQKLVNTVAAKVSQQKVAEAVEIAAKFLKEQQEFCLLSGAGMRQLIESSLASNMEFNSFLINDVATLMHKTNLKVNHDSIVECWSKTAQKAQHAELLVKAKGLSEAKDFAAEYELFLEGVFSETGSIDDNKAKAYLTSLRIVKSVLSHVEGNEQLVQDMERMVSSLESEQPATDVMFQAEELLASLSDELVGRVDNLSNFDRMPGVEEDPMAPEEAVEDEAPVPLPDLGGEEEMPDMGMDMGAPAPAAAGAGAPAMEPAMAGAGMGFESKNKKAKPVTEEYTAVEKMNLLEIQEELLSWKTDGHIYLKEDGFEDCYSQLNRYIDRCMALGTSADVVREEFETIRDVVIDSGSDVSLDLPNDPYADSVNLKESSKVKADYMPLAEDLGGLAGPAKGPKVSGDASGMSELQSGEGLSKKDLQKVDGTDSKGAPSNGGAAGHDVGLGMAKDNMSKTKGLAAKELKKVSGQDAANTPNPGGAEKGDTDMGKELLNKSKSIAEASFIDRIAATLGEEEQKLGTSHKTGAGYTKSHDMKMDELQGKDGVETGEVQKVDGTDAKGVPSAKGAEKGDLDMAKDHQDKTKGLAESDEQSDEVVSEVPENDEVPANEDQYKGPRRHDNGKKKAALSPKEVKKEEIEKIADTVSEDVAVFKSDDRLDDVIMKVLEHMKTTDMGNSAMGMPGELPMGGEPGLGGEMGGMDGMDGMPQAEPMDMPLPGGDAPVGDEPPMGGDMGMDAPMGGEAPAGGPPMMGDEPMGDAASMGGDELPMGGDEAPAPEGEKKAPPFEKKDGGEKKDKKDDSKGEKKDKKDDDKEEKKDDKKKEESFNRALHTKLETLSEEFCADCDSKKCKCPKKCKKCDKAKCSCK